MPRQIQGSQTDFFFGEVDVALKRNDNHPAHKGGLRQMANARILNSGALQGRSGRRALYPITNNGKRTERFAISSGNVFDIQFAAGNIKIINSAGVTVANIVSRGNGAALPWVTTADINLIVYAIFNLSIYITFGHSMRPQVITFDGVATWTISEYAELVTAGGQKRTPFYRLSPQNILMTPSATTGAITVVFSQSIVVAGMVGTRVRYAGRQILLGSVINAASMNATVIEPLPPSQTLALTSSIGNFTIGDEVIGGTSGARGIVVASPTIQSFDIGPIGSQPGVGSAVTGGTSGATGIVIAVGPDGASFIYTVSLNTGTSFVVGETVSGGWGSNTISFANPTSLIAQLTSAPTFVAETIAGPSGSAIVSGATTQTPKAIAVWDDEIMNDFRGYPASVFVDQFRLGFCDFPAIPGGIGWSAINSPTDNYIGPNPFDAMFEIAPRKVRIFHVIPGPEGSEFVMCDRAMWYIPISPTNPLRPGSVQFMLLSGDGCAQVQPRLAQEAILYVNAGQNSVMAVIATGAYNRPYNTKNLSDLHGHLFNNIAAIAVPSADDSIFSERYAYVLNGDGSIAVGKYSPDSLATNLPVIGWGPWSGVGAVSWIAAYAADVIFTSSYFGAAVLEILDDAQYLDCALPVNAAPAAFAPPAGKGPLWFIPSQSVSLMDQVTRSMGTYQIDANGFIVPQNNGGENLLAASLVAGQPWTMTVEPFAPEATSGADMGQRMKLRQYSYFAVYVIHSTGFMFASLFSRKPTRTSPPPGTIEQFRRVPAWNIDDDPTKPPTQQETAELWTPPGSSYDPRVAIIKDTPGPMQIVEIAMEIST